MSVLRRRGGVRYAALLAVLGPGLLAGLSDDDPAGITTYSMLGADYGYQLLWVLLLSTVALVIFHGLAARMGVVTGQGLIGLVRQRYGVRVGGAVLAALVVANIGTTCAEFAGIAAGFEIFGISRYISVPAAAAIVSLLVLRGSFHRVERLLLPKGDLVEHGIVQAQAPNVRIDRIAASALVKRGAVMSMYSIRKSTIALPGI
jgi:Mn2+/Fe2+ NRAMP family transporter